MANKEYDVSIIGGGIGGLCAGALLSNYGYKVLLIEKRNILGGRWSTEEIDGFKLPTGAIVIHKGGLIEDVFKKVGKDFQGIVSPGLYYRIEGKDYEVSAKGAVGKMLDLISNMEVSKTKMLGAFAKGVATEKIKMAFRRGVQDPEKMQVAR